MLKTRLNQQAALAVGEVRGFTPESIERVTDPIDGRGMRWDIGTATHMPINAVQGSPPNGNCSNCRWENMASFHPGGVHGLFADGSVKFLNENIDGATFWALGSRAGSEVVNEF